MPPEIQANRVLPVLRQLKDALITTEERALFVSGTWGIENHEYVNLIRDWPVTDVGFHRVRERGFWKILGLLLSHNFVLELEDPAFLVNIFQLFHNNHSFAVWSVGKAEAEHFKAELLAQSLEPGCSNTALGGNLMQFAPNLFWLKYLEDIGDDEPYLFLRCGEKVPPALQRIITDNNLEPYVEYAAKH